MKRGDIVAVAAGRGYAGKPRPAVVIQSDDFSGTDSLTVCLLTSDAIDAPLLRLPVQPDATNNLAIQSWIMVDKILTIRRRQVGRIIGRLATSDILRLNRALMVFFGVA